MAVTMRNTLATIETAALVASTPKAIAWGESDEKMVLVINNTASSAVSLTVKAGNGIQGVVDLVVSVPKGISLLKLESGRFKNVSGENKGKIVVVSDGTPAVGVAALV